MMSANIDNNVVDVISCVVLFYEKGTSGNSFLRKEKFRAQLPRKEKTLVRLGTAKTANAESRLVVCRSVRDVCLFKLPELNVRSKTNFFQLVVNHLHNLHEMTRDAPFLSPSLFSLLLTGGALAQETKGSGDKTGDTGF